MKNYAVRAARVINDYVESGLVARLVSIWRALGRQPRSTRAFALCVVLAYAAGCDVPPPDEDMCAMLREAETWRTGTYDSRDLQYVAGSVPERLGHRTPGGEFDYAPLASIKTASGDFFWSLREFDGMSFRRATLDGWRAFVMECESVRRHDRSQIEALMNERIVVLAALAYADETGPGPQRQLAREYFDACPP